MIIIYHVKRQKKKIQGCWYILLYHRIVLLDYIIVSVVCITVLSEWDLGNTDRFPGASMYHWFGCVSFWGLRPFC